MRAGPLREVGPLPRTEHAHRRSKNLGIRSRQSASLRKLGAASPLPAERRRESLQRYAGVHLEIRGASDDDEWWRVVAEEHRRMPRARGDFGGKGLEPLRVPALDAFSDQAQPRDIRGALRIRVGLVPHQPLLQSTRDVLLVPDILLQPLDGARQLPRHHGQAPYGARDHVTLLTEARQRASAAQECQPSTALEALEPGHRYDADAAGADHVR